MLIDDESLELRHAILYDPRIRALKFLISPYKRTMYAYDVYDMARRLFFTTILPLLSEKDTIR